MQNYFSIQFLWVVKSLWRVSNKIPLSMRLLILFLVCSIGLCYASDSYAQKTLISIDVHNQRVEDILKEIEEQSDFDFFFNNKHVDLNRRVSISVDRSNIFSVLKEVFAGTNVRYSVLDKKIILSVEVQSPQQEKKMIVSAIISDVQGEPVIGASIQEKGVVGKGTVSDLDGKFKLTVASDAILVISYIGFQSLEVKVGNRTNLSVVLKEDHQLLDEVVVIGYGTMEKRAVTSSITSISSKDLVTGMGGSTIATALKGKISGMNVSETSSPNASASFQLRGVASINASSSPLIVIDGIPGGDLRSISQEDIQSIDVLKDASAGAIYGTRAAGGVILVTTKKAKEGPITLSYTGELSTEQVSRRPQVLDRDAFVRFGVGTDLGASTDWYGELLNEGALSQRHVVNLSGGGHTAKIYATIMAQDQKGIAIGDNRKDYSGRINANFNLLDDLLEIGLHTEYREAHRDQRSSSSYFDMALKMNPTEHVYDSTSETGYNVLVGGSEYYNPLAEVMLKQADNVDKWLKADATVKLNLPAGFSAQATLGWEDRQYQQTHYTSALHRTSLNGSYKGRGFHAYSKTVNVSFEPTINFMRVFADDHTVSAVAGYSYWENNSENFNMTNYDFPVDGVGAWDMGTGSWLSDGKAAMSSHKYPRERLISFFGRANYSYKDRYMLTGSVRHEGSSKFGKNHRWGTFWAVSGGWRISNEAFLRDVSFLDDLKVRVGYGVTGNNNFSAGASTAMYSSNSMWPYNGTWITSYGPARNVNYDLHWEKKAELNIGLDYAFLNNRLFGKFDIYKRRVSGMLYNINVPNPPAVYETTTMNYGNLENTGWEFEIGGVPVKTRNFNWTTTMRLSHSSSKITSLWGNNTYQDRVGFPSPGTNGSAGRIEAGTKIGSYYIWKYAGITDNGRWLLYDKNDNVILSDKKTYDDKRYIGNAIPALMVSWDHTFTYKNLSLGINLRSWIDFDVFNTINMYYGLSEVAGQNVLRNAYIDNRHIKEVKQLCDYWLEDGTFLKIDAISLGYSLNMKKWQKYIDKIDLYLTVRNVACFTKYSGLNPEVNVNGLDPGYEWFNNIYPETRRYTFGMKIQF